MNTDKEGNIVIVNEGFTRITGYPKQEAIGLNPRVLKSGKHDASFYRKMWDDLAKTGQWKGEIWNKNKSGYTYPELLNISEVKDSRGLTVNYVAVFSDITKLKETEKKLVEANERLQKISSLDGLTGIPNRRTFDFTMEKEWNRALQSQNPISLIMLDIDYFKKYNDTYGHLEGDECLKKVATSLASSVTGLTDVVTRYGGEEFAIILPDTNQMDANLFAEKIRKNIELLEIPHINSLVSNHVTISMGVATLMPKHSIKFVELIHNADQALYEAKESGRNQVKSYEIKLESIVLR
ncbi:diguanylate cyclase domain-containing protein [Cytobacillus sp. FJAT-54145]|uniref:Diguanylate cyclase domain-containing protein n=1 Tax=Cytobacillus spartinae TaxID=3299023 RepID=A0ABW6K9S0_9BACI